MSITRPQLQVARSSARYSIPGHGSYGIARLQIEAEVPEAGVTSRVFALPWGETTTKDSGIRLYCGEAGTLVVDERTAEMVPKHFAERTEDFFINVNHEKWGPAYGWISGVEVVGGDGLYILVEWNEEGIEAIRGRKYRYFSGELPYEFLAESTDINDDMVPDKGRVIAVTGGALTNRPAIGGLGPVELAQLTAMLGCGSITKTGDASPGEGTKMSDGKAKWWEWASLRKYIPGVSDETEAALAVAELGRKAGTAEADLVAANEKITKLTADLVEATDKTEKLKADLAAKESELTELQGASAKGKAELAVSKALAERRIRPADKEFWLEKATADLADFEATVSRIHAGTAGPAAGAVVDPNADTPVEGSGPVAEAARIRAHQAKLTEQHGKSVTFGDAALDLERITKEGGA